MTLDRRLEWGCGSNGQSSGPPVLLTTRHTSPHGDDGWGQAKLAGLTMQEDDDKFASLEGAPS